MKNLKIFISLFAVIAFMNIRSIYAENPPVFPDNLNKHLVNEIVYPEDAKSENIEGFVLVSFIVGDGGKIQITGINSSDETLKKYVINRLESIQLCPYDLSVGKEFNMKFDFRLLKE